jgi:hypothetical protein
MGGIILEQVGQHLWAGKVVYGDDFRTLVRKHLAESQTTNTTKAVNCNLNCHALSFHKAAQGLSPAVAFASTHSFNSTQLTEEVRQRWHFKKKKVGK